MKAYIRAVLLPLSLALISSSCALLSRQDRNYTERAKHLNIKMVKVKGDKFMMGCQDDEGYKDEFPRHEIILDDFHISRFEVTFDQYDKFCLATEREKVYDLESSRKSRPVVLVSWYDANDFCTWLSSITGETYRLPTEAEWEYAASGGKKSKGRTYSGSERVDEVAWVYHDNYNHEDSLKYMKSQVVGSKKSNELGIYDMSGNVWEWCYDSYDKDFYKKSPLKNPKKEGAGSTELQVKIQNTAIVNVTRGGGWESPSIYSKVTNRDYDHTNAKDYDLGFRIVRVLNKK
ncbi:formylglycine-generating enzyme family protein [Halosquirtibacter xylanolyticus]|uniref:formylglycine-generating enzyme family protein n=1 Tax=Halosquirtibacter xylanolyticus TaxID=3374599 RepID=UPI0037498AD2|nr:formylglycine-generating enzyme family protein [Prolixibacteraceae bacterium]